MDELKSDKFKVLDELRDKLPVRSRNKMSDTVYLVINCCTKRALGTPPGFVVVVFASEQM